MEMNLDLIKYNDRIIAFDFKSEVVNATDMMKGFQEKKMNNFLRQKQTKEFIKVLEKSDTLISVLTDNKAVIVKYGGVNHGTWMHRLLAFKFAAWLSPEFELFIYKTFDESIKNKLRQQQSQLDYFWDKEDQNDLYNRRD